VVTAAAIEARIAELTEQRNTLAGQVIDLTDQLHKIQQAVNQAQSKK
jgi:prefoldin subunit 5